MVSAYSCHTQCEILCRSTGTLWCHLSILLVFCLIPTLRKSWCRPMSTGSEALLSNNWCVAEMHSCPGAILLSYRLDIRTCWAAHLNQGWSRSIHQSRLCRQCFPACEEVTRQDLQDATRVIELNISWQKTRVQNLGAGPQESLVKVGSRTVKSID